MMASRRQSLTITYVAWDTSSNAGKTGDVENHTLRWIKDGTSAAPTNTPSEVDPTNAPGVYRLTLTAGECTCSVGVLAGKSSTANVVIIPVTITFEQLPTAPAGTGGGLPTVDTNNRVMGVQQAVGLTATERSAIADAVLARDVGGVEAGAPEHSLCTIVLAALESQIDGSTWTIKRTDGSTTHAAKTVVKDANAEPITGVS
jgi:hypothetical protein